MSTALAVAALVAAAAPVALAHATYKASDPADESTVASPPGEVWAEFTQPVTSSSSMKVYDPCGNQVDNGDSNAFGYEITVTMSADKAGVYTVEYAAQSASDTHVTSGTFTFRSTGGAACPGSQPVAADPDPGGGDGPNGDDGDSSRSGSAAPSSGAGSTEVLASAGGSSSNGGDSGSTRGGGSGGAAAQRGGRNTGSRTSGTNGLVASGPTGTSEAPAPWDLPLSGLAVALALCVLIGAAGGRVYDGIVAPPRR